MATEKSSSNPTPNGGVRSKCFYLDDDDQPADETVATKTLIVEYDRDGNGIYRTYGILTKE
jgi:hypothetical protein